MFMSIFVKYDTIYLNQLKHHLNGKQLVNKQFPPLFFINALGSEILSPRRQCSAHGDNQEPSTRLSISPGALWDILNLTTVIGCLRVGSRKFCSLIYMSAC